MPGFLLYRSLKRRAPGNRPPPAFVLHGYERPHHTPPLPAIQASHRNRKVCFSAFRWKAGQYISSKNAFPILGRKHPIFERLLACREEIFPARFGSISQVVRYLTHVEGTLALPRTIVEHPVHCSARHPGNNSNLLDGNGHRLLPLSTNEAKRQRRFVVCVYARQPDVGKNWRDFYANGFSLG